MHLRNNNTNKTPVETSFDNPYDNNLSASLNVLVNNNRKVYERD